MQQSDVYYKLLIVASCWFSLSSHFAHYARSQEPKGCNNGILKIWIIWFLVISLSQIL